MSATECTLLIVDDEYWVRENLRAMLSTRELPIAVLEPAVDGEDAARRIEAERPDILITDITMPFMNGNDLIREVRKRHPRMPVIVLSGYRDFRFVRDALLSGAVDYLLKPVTKDALLDVVGRALSMLHASLAHEQEQAQLGRKLAMASSIIRDQGLSNLIAEDMSDEPGQGAADLDLQFAAFTLILVKLADLPRLLRRGSARASSISRTVKETLSRCAGAGKAVAFHNVYARSEFILLTDLGERGVTDLCAHLPARLERCTGSRVSVAVSGSYFLSHRLRSAYQEARTSLLTRTVGSSGVAVRAEETGKTVVKKRLTSEMENRLLYSLQTENRKLAREVIFDQSGLRRCERDGWLLVEVKQTAEYVAGVIIQHAAQEASPSSMLSMENMADLLGAALDAEDLSEVRSVLDQLLEEALGEPAPAGVSDSTHEKVQRVQAHIREKYFEPLSLTSLSALFALERSSLSKAFKLVTGCNLMSAIAKRRIERAAQYIREEDLSLSDISYLVGYEEYAYFNRVFRKIMGMSPSEYKSTVGRERPV
jgi:YesN/AraC family two-component response regulator